MRNNCITFIKAVAILIVLLPGCNSDEVPKDPVHGVLSAAVEYNQSPVYLAGDFSGNRGVYIWITDRDSIYIDTVQQYHDPSRSLKSRWRDDNPLNWIKATGREYSLDGVTAASMSGDESGIYESQEWDCYDSDGEEISQGEYRVWVEITTHDQLSLGSGDYIGDDPKLFSGEVDLSSESTTAYIEGDEEITGISIEYINELHQ